MQDKDQKVKGCLMKRSPLSQMNAEKLVYSRNYSVCHISARGGDHQTPITSFLLSNRLEMKKWFN